jgi:3'-phosphoadenosine 5'-phosphosulfate sulfotransferase (PAPS reductase)/FAD synthetase
MLVSWFSAGVSSAVATKIATRHDTTRHDTTRHDTTRIIYIDIDDQHPDTHRFITDCAAWFDTPIEILKSPLASVGNACLQASYINGPHGAACTRLLKKRVRKEWEMANPGRHTYVWGFDGEERERMDRIVEAMPEYDHVFPLTEYRKTEVHAFMAAAGIKRPEMYEMGYSNNNCVGCLKGGMGYWNKIRVDFPEVFARRVTMERKLGHHMLKECVLDELDPKRGRMEKEIMPDCGLFCELPF